MVRKHIMISMIAPVAIAGILIMAILANHQLINSGNAAQESSNSGNTSQGANNTGPATPNTITTTTQQLLPALHHPTPIVTTTHHNIVTATSEQLSNNGILPKRTLAPKPTLVPKPTLAPGKAKPTIILAPKPNEATVGPRVQGAKTIAEAQQLKKAEEIRLAQDQAYDQHLMRTGIQFDPKKEICEDGRIAKDSSGKLFCVKGFFILNGKVVSEKAGKVVPRPFSPTRNLRVFLRGK